MVEEESNGGWAVRPQVRDRRNDYYYICSRKTSHEGLIRCWWAAQMSLVSDDVDAPLQHRAVVQLIVLYFWMSLLKLLAVVEPRM